MGAFDPAERSQVVDLFGFDGQLVFATFATAMFMGKDEDLLYAGSAAHNRAVAAFCEDDPRLLPVGFVPLNDTDRAVALLEEAIDLGCTAVHVPSTAAGDRSPTHPDLDPFWSLLERQRRALRAARRWRRPAARPGVPRQRAAGDRPPRRRREHPLQGLPRHRPLAVAVPRAP